MWFLHALSEARLIAIVGVGHRSTERKLLLWKDDLKKMKVELLLALPKGLELTCQLCYPMMIDRLPIWVGMKRIDDQGS
jgi:hypothetical protein